LSISNEREKKATKYEASGNVRFDITEKGIHYIGHAQKIIYQPNSSKYYFYGNVLLKRFKLIMF